MNVRRTKRDWRPERRGGTGKAHGRWMWSRSNWRWTKRWKTNNIGEGGEERIEEISRCQKWNKKGTN